MKYGIKLKAYLKKEFDKNPLYKNNHIDAKIKIYDNVVHTNFYYKIALKICIHFILIHFYFCLYVFINILINRFPIKLNTR